MEYGRVACLGAHARGIVALRTKEASRVQLLFDKCLPGRLSKSLIRRWCAPCDFDYNC